MLLPSDVKAPQTALDDPRLGHLILKESKESPRVVLVGFPSDEGVRRSGGRVGAAEAPDHIRRALYKLTPDPVNHGAFCRLMEATHDAGNLEVTGDLERDQERLGNQVAKWLAKGAIPIILGGGHETAFGHFLGYAKNKTPVNILNIDAHADVRPLNEGKAHSGSPFYQAIEYPDKMCKHYSVMGLMPWAVSRAHVDYLERHNGTYHWIDDVTPAFVDNHFNQIKVQTMLTLDMDVVTQQSAPGVSAPAARGLPLSTFMQIAYLAGKSPQVSSMDLVEVNPRCDIDQQTARAAAVAVWSFLNGLTKRLSL